MTETHPDYGPQEDLTSEADEFVDEAADAEVEPGPSPYLPGQQVPAQDTVDGSIQ